MSETRASIGGGVRNLRAMFENSEATSSPEPRGRSPATSVGSDNSRTTSKVRASFVPVEPKDALGKDSETSKVSHKSAMSEPVHADNQGVDKAQDIAAMEEVTATDSSEPETQKSPAKGNITVDEQATASSKVAVKSDEKQNSPEVKSKPAPEESKTLGDTQDSVKTDGKDRGNENAVGQVASSGASKPPAKDPNPVGELLAPAVSSSEKPSAPAVNSSEKQSAPAVDISEKLSTTAVKSSEETPTKAIDSSNKSPTSVGPSAVQSKVVVSENTVTHISPTKHEEFSVSNQQLEEPNNKEQIKSKAPAEQKIDVTPSKQAKEPELKVETSEQSNTAVEEKESSKQRSKTVQELKSVFKAKDSETNGSTKAPSKDVKQSSTASARPTPISTPNENTKASNKAVKSPSKSPRSPRVLAETSTDKPVSKRSSTILSKQTQPKEASTKSNRASIRTSGSSIVSPTATKTADKLSPSSGKESTTSTGFVKPRPRSPTRPVKLPSHLTAQTASSAAKHDSTKPDTGISRRQSTLVRERTVASKATAPSKKANRASLPPQPHKKPETRNSTSSKATDNGFLARMMRPTASSANKTHEKVEMKSPPRGAPTTKKGHSGGLQSKAKSVKESLHKAKDAVTLNGHAEKSAAADQSAAEAPTAKEGPVPHTSDNTEATTVEVIDSKEATN